MEYARTNNRKAPANIGCITLKNDLIWSEAALERYREKMKCKGFVKKVQQLEDKGIKALEMLEEMIFVLGDSNKESMISNLKRIDTNVTPIRDITNSI